MTQQEILELATYNAEVARGVVHTNAWDARMAAAQRKFDDEQKHNPRPHYPAGLEKAKP